MNDLEVLIYTEKRLVMPAVLEAAEWETERKAKAGTFKFKCLFDELGKFEEGDIVKVKYKGVRTVVKNI